MASRHPGLFHASLAGAAYFAVAFSAGFALGAVRTLALEPRMGETAAVLAELPVMLAIAWLAAGAIIRRGGIPRVLMMRAMMGAVAFLMLMTAELALAVIVFGQTVSTFFADLSSPPGALGLAGQILFGLIPVLRR